MGHLVPSLSLECAACFLLAHSTPLFKEKWGLLSDAMFMYGFHPLAVHGSCTGAALAAYDYPINVFEIKRWEVREQGFH